MLAFSFFFIVGLTQSLLKAFNEDSLLSFYFVLTFIEMTMGQIKSIPF